MSRRLSQNHSCLRPQAPRDLFSCGVMPQGFYGDKILGLTLPCMSNPYFVRFDCMTRSLEFSIGLVLETQPLQLALSAEVSQPSHHSGGTHILTAAPGRLPSCSPWRRLPRTYSQALGIIHPACQVLLEASQRQLDC